MMILRNASESNATGVSTNRLSAIGFGLRIAPVILALALFVGCAHDDPRLQGTWRSNRDATVSAAFARDPSWTKAAPAKVERFKDLFGHMSITYSNGVASMDFSGKIQSFHYRAIKRGPDYVVIRTDAPKDTYRDFRVTFIDDGASYWIDTGPFGFGMLERFDRAQDK